MKPAAGDYAAFAELYISLVPQDDLRGALAESIDELEQYLTIIPEGKADYAYAEGKWTVKQALQHVIDAERVFAYRALALGRGEQQALPGFDQDRYMDQVDVSQRELDALKDELVLVRSTTLLLFDSISDEQLLYRGTASNHPFTALSFGFMIIGHWLHHKNIFIQKYGIV